MRFGRRKNGGSAVADGRPEVAEAERLEAQGDLYGAIDRLQRGQPRAHGTPIWRCASGGCATSPAMKLLADPVKDPSYADPEGELPAPGEQSRIPEVTPDQLTGGLLRAGILQYGCLLVRGLMDPDKATRMAGEIEHAFDVRRGSPAASPTPTATTAR